MEVVKLKPTLLPDACVSVPGSKSYTNRALVIASLASGLTRLTGVSPSTDSITLCDALSKLGVSIRSDQNSCITVHGGVERLSPYKGTIDVGPAGTAMRFLAALCAAIPGADITLKGSDRMHQRPIGDLVTTLRQAGATIEYLGSQDCPPLRIHSNKRLTGSALSINGSVSSQFISAVTLITPLFQHGLELSLVGQETSISYLNMTLQSIEKFGITAAVEEDRVVRAAPNQSYNAQPYQIEGDASGASYLWAIAAVSGGKVTVDNINPQSAQGDIRFPTILRQMGCSVTTSGQSITVVGPRTLCAIDVDMENLPDTAQTLAVVAACAEGTSTIRGLKTLRVKETDRIAALHTELAKVGIITEPGPDYIRIHGSRPHRARIATYDDHRMAMSFAVLGALSEGIEIEEPHVVRKSFPDFWNTLDQIGIQVDHLSD